MNLRQKKIAVVLFTASGGAGCKKGIVEFDANGKDFCSCTNVIPKKIILFDGIDRSDNRWGNGLFMEGDIIMAESQALSGLLVDA